MQKLARLALLLVCYALAGAALGLALWFVTGAKGDWSLPVIRGVAFMVTFWIAQRVFRRFSKRERDKRRTLAETTQAFE